MGENREKFIVFGGGNTLKKTLERARKNSVELPIKYIVDNNKDLHGKKIEGYMIFPPEVLKEETETEKIVIACLDDGVILNIYDQLKHLGMESKFRLYTMQDIITPYIYEKVNKVELYTCGIIFSTNCTMRCKQCSTMIPFIKDKRHISVTEMKEWLENYFNIVDYVRIINIFGGEPLIHPELREVIELLLKRKERFDELVITTNATVIPSDEVLEVCKDNGIQFQISDYGNMNKDFVKTMEKWNINYFIRPIESWYELFNDTLKKDELGAKETCGNCDYANYHTQLFENKLFSCPIVTGLHAAGRREYFSESDYFDLEKELKQNGDCKKDYIDFLNKKRGNSYITACRHCYGTDKEHLTAVAEQM